MARILIVDDDQNMASLTKMALVKKGYDVALLHEGSKLIEEVKRQRPNLILMDIMMPKISGAEAVRSLRKDPALKDIAVVFLTALILSDEDAEALGITIEGSNYQSLGKPYEIDNLYKIVEKALGKKEERENE